MCLNIYIFRGVLSVSIGDSKFAFVEFTLETLLAAAGTVYSTITVNMHICVTCAHLYL